METLSSLKTKKVGGVPAFVVAIIVLVCASLSFGFAIVAKKNGGVAPMLNALKASKGNPMKALEGLTCGKKREGYQEKESEREIAENKRRTSLSTSTSTHNLPARQDGVDETDAQDADDVENTDDNVEGLTNQKTCKTPFCELTL